MDYLDLQSLFFSDLKLAGSCPLGFLRARPITCCSISPTTYPPYKSYALATLLNWSVQICTHTSHLLYHSLPHKCICQRAQIEHYSHKPQLPNMAYTWSTRVASSIHNYNDFIGNDVLDKIMGILRENSCMGGKGTHAVVPCRVREERALAIMGLKVH